MNKLTRQIMLKQQNLITIALLKKI